jgi:multicomponent Na+:H+ antiporter subunit E
MPPRTRAAEGRMHLTSLILSTALWWVLTGGDSPSWVIGAPAIGAALLVRRGLRPLAAAKPSLGGGLRFLAGFFKASLVSGIDVVRRAFHPRLPLKPGLIDYGLSVQSPLARMLTAGTVSLLPGTLSAELKRDRLTVHVLDLDAPVLRDLQRTEALVAGLCASAPTPGVRGEHE